MFTFRLCSAMFLAAALGAATAAAQMPGEAAMTKQSQALVPAGPWPKGDEQGMANTLGQGTWQRCAYYLSRPNAKEYEVSHIRSATMSSSPFGAPLKYDYRPTVGIPGTVHAFNGETVAGETAAQGTQMDAIGHFAFLSKPWDGKGEFPSDDAHYYGGYTQAQVKPSKDAPLARLGIDKAPPIVTSAVLLDARAYMGHGGALKPGQTITSKDILGMIKAQGLEWRGLLPGDVLYIYTGWSENWADPDTTHVYYTRGPGLSHEAAQFLRTKEIVLVALDNPFTDPVNEGQLMGKAGPPDGTPPGMPFSVHHENLAVSGIHQIQNAKLADMARDKVWTSCTMILPLRVKGGAGSEVRPVAIGAPHS
jgi:kynurenine formamidase